MQKMAAQVEFFLFLNCFLSRELFGVPSQPSSWQAIEEIGWTKVNFTRGTLEGLDKVNSEMSASQ